MNKYLPYLTYDLPIPYKTLNIYPVKMRDYLHFMAFSQVLTIAKNDIPDAKIIQMKYLEFLIRQNTDENNYLRFLDGLLRLVLNKPDLSVQFGMNNRRKPLILIESEAGGTHQFLSEDFDEIRAIIVEQNTLEVPDESIQKEIRERLEDAKRLKRRGKSKPATLEELMVSVMISTSLSLEDIYDMPIRKFMMALKRVDTKLHYEIYTAARVSGMVKFLDESVIKHWLENLDADEKDGFITIDDVDRAINPRK